MLNPEQEGLASRLESAIEASDLSKSEIADECDVTPQAITGWLNTGRISKQNLAAVAKLTGTSFSWLLTGEGSRKPTTTYEMVGHPVKMIHNKVRESLAKATPRSLEALERIAKKLESGSITEDDLALLEQIADYLESKSAG